MHMYQNQISMGIEHWTNNNETKHIFHGISTVKRPLFRSIFFFSFPQFPMFELNEW